MSVWDEGRTLVGEGENLAALDLIENFIKGRMNGPAGNRVRPLLENIIMLRARGRRLSDKKRLGTLTNNDGEVEQAKIDEAILSLISDVERMDQLRPPTISVSVSVETINEKLMASESHLRSTGWLREGLRLASAVCRLVGDQTFGTGFRCREDMIVTNHHVIQTREEASSFRAEFLFEENAAGTLQIPLTVMLEPQRFFWTSASLDVTLVGISPIAHADIAVVPVVDGVDGRVGDHVSIIQHPSGGPKQIAVTNNRILNVYNQRVHYLTDTLPGSSGSPVFLDSWRLLAIHRAGGNVQKNSRGDVIFANEGVLASAILSDEDFRAAYKSSG